MKTKAISLAILSLSVCTLAMAADYKTPLVGFRETAPSNNATNMTEVHDDYKVEEAVSPDRQIASEKDSSERVPSSIVAEDKKPMGDDDMKVEGKIEPKPWLYRNKLDSAY